MRFAARQPSHSPLFAGLTGKEAASKALALASRAMADSGEPEGSEAFGGRPITCGSCTSEGCGKAVADA